MNTITITDILKIHGKWIDSDALISLVAEKKGISGRQAYRDIKKAVGNRDILKEELPGGRVRYGLVEFGREPSREAELIRAYAQIRAAEIQALGNTERL